MLFRILAALTFSGATFSASVTLFSAMSAGIFAVGMPLLAADIHGAITINRKLTHRNVTASAGIYQHGAAVELGADPEKDPLSFERAHVAVYLEAVSAAESAPAPSGMQTAERSAEFTMEQRDRRFVPDLVVIPLGAVVSFPNFDPVFHNVFSLSKAKSFDLGNYAKGDTRRVTFSSPGVVAVYCHLHPNMAASIVVAPSAFAVRADRDGAFVLKEVPPGKYTIVAWHKMAGTFRQTVVLTPGGLSGVNFVLPYVEPPDASHVAHR